ncbi:MAG TPA: hypothetical protein VFK05_26250 [Polyangiaceae bacterium]|nr:hypothetical protein [Polyangiaceae bacterium]
MACCALGGFYGLARSVHAAPGSGAEAEQNPSLAQVEVAMLGDVERDPVLFERIRSLFPPQTAVVLSTAHELDQRAVLLPQRSDTVYIWIRVTERSRARVYLSLVEQGEDAQARYLFRELELDSGLDEVGGETLAEVAHSSARALWSREQQSSRQALVDALDREAKAPAESRLPPPAVSVSASTQVRDSSPVTSHATNAAPESPAFRLGIGASGTTHNSGAEGWLQELGAFLTCEYRARLSLRLAVHYLLPSDFSLPPARVHLNGASGEFRAGWLSNDATRMRVRLEAGLGVLLGRAQATIVEPQPAAHAFAGQDFERSYALTAAGFEWPLGPAWIAASVDLRVPLRTTSYEVNGQSGASTSSSLSPGGSLEVGIGFDPALR